MQFISIAVALLLLEYLLIFPTIDRFSLEDDDANELFITQTPSNNNDGVKLIGSLADPMDFSKPCQLLLPASASKRVDFSDILAMKYLIFLVHKRVRIRWTEMEGEYNNL